MRHSISCLLLSLTFLLHHGAADWVYDEFKYPNGSTYPLQGPTVVAVGPDLRYYIGGIGRVDALTVDANYIVTDKCTSVGLNEYRMVMGITFDPTFFWRDEIIMFVSTSFLTFAGGPSAVPDPTSWAWANGRVDIFKTNVEGNCLAQVGALVTGLPVSNHDHGVNGLTITWDGHLLISNGGMTNAGHSEQGDGDGGYPATPLSGALLQANYTKPGFEGNVLYTVPDGRETQISNNPDVFIYASGFMNAFSVRIHTNGEIYMVDNGPNPGYGRQSTSCTRNLPTDPHYPDKFLRVEKGNWYGHPNRNRGRFTPGERRQCVFRPLGTRRGGKSPEIMSIESSTNGLTEFSSGVLGASFKGSFCLATIGFDAIGSSFSLTLNADGTDVVQREEIFTDNGGLDMVMDRYASLIVTEYMGNKVKVFRPLPVESFLAAEVAVVSVFPNRGPPQGGNRVIITAKLPQPLYTLGVWFGGEMATNIVYSDWATIECMVPAGVEMSLVHVYVVANGWVSPAVGAGDYRYMETSANRRFPDWIRAMQTVVEA